MRVSVEVTEWEQWEFTGRTTNQLQVSSVFSCNSALIHQLISNDNQLQRGKIPSDLILSEHPGGHAPDSGALHLTGTYTFYYTTFISKL